MASFRQRLSNVPVLGYLLRLGLDIVTLPIMRSDLSRDIQTAHQGQNKLRQDFQAAHEGQDQLRRDIQAAQHGRDQLRQDIQVGHENQDHLSSQTKMVVQHIGGILESLSRLSDRTVTAERAQASLSERLNDLRLQFAETSRRARRDTEALRRDLESVGRSVAELRTHREGDTQSHSRIMEEVKVEIETRIRAQIELTIQAVRDNQLLAVRALSEDLGNASRHETEAIRKQVEHTSEDLRQMRAFIEEFSLARKQDADVLCQQVKQLREIDVPAIRRLAEDDGLSANASIARLGQQIEQTLAAAAVVPELQAADSQGRQALSEAKQEVENLRNQVQHLLDHTTNFLAITRSEMLHEVKLALGSRDQRPVQKVITPRFINPGKLFGMSSNMRLNLGSGPIGLTGYLNVDQRELVGVDLVAELGNLPFEPGTISEIYSAHTLEHFGEDELKARLLPYWFGLLRPDGRLRIIVPDAEAMIEAFAKGAYSFHKLRLSTFGGQDYDGNYHFTMFSRDSLRDCLTSAGFAAGDYAAVGRVNGDCMEMEITARKP